MSKHKAWLWGLPVLSLLGCASIGKSLGDGLMQAVDDKAPSIGRGIVRGAGDGVREDVLTDPTTAKLNATVESVVGHAVSTAVNTAGDEAVKRLPDVREQAIGKPTQDELRRLVETVLIVAEARARHASKGLMTDVGDGLRGQVLTDETYARLNVLVAQLGGTARGQVDQMRDDVLGKETDQHVKVLVDSAMGAVIDGTERIRRQAHQELSFVQRNTAETLIALGVVAALAVWFLWRQKEKNRMLLNLLTRHLQELSDHQAYPGVINSIRKGAQLLGVENQLKGAFAEEGALTARTGAP